MARKQLTKRADGRYRKTVTYQDPQTGETKRAAIYGKTIAEVNAKEKEIRARVAEGSPVRDASRTLSDWLEEWRKTSLAASDRAESTKALYRTLSTKHLEPALGALPLGKIRPVDVSKAMLELQDKKLAASTVRNAYACLRAALDDAVVNGLIAANPALKVKRPAAQREEAVSLTPAQAKALLEAAEVRSIYRPGHPAPRYARAMRLLLATGLRRGELLALRWADVDLRKAEAKVKGSLGRTDAGLVVAPTKTASSVRTVLLSPGAVKVLKAQKAAQIEDRLKAANIWTDTGFVFTTETGQPVDGRTLLRAVTSAAKAVGLTDVGAHTLRHTYATTALEAGVPIHVVSRNLGHASISITVDIYGHVSDDASRDAAAKVSDALGI